MRINVRIERVVLDGVPVARHQAPALHHAMEAGLRRLLAVAPRSHLPSSGAAVPVLRSPMLAAAAGDADGWGERIAGAVRAAVEGRYR
jgi:hypothetical protein